MAVKRVFEDLKSRLRRGLRGKAGVIARRAGEAGALFCVLAASMAATLTLLIAQGRWREAIPLHLCSLSALAAGALALKPSAWLLDFLWYLGMPGAALALLFPAPAVSRFQTLMTASYVLTHAMILVIPLWAMRAGMRPRGGKGLHALLALQGIALVSALVNRALGTDFLFLSAPPLGTPLEAVFALGYPVYLAALEAMMTLCVMGMERLRAWAFERGAKRNQTPAEA